ncbi:MAG: hypothetical protein ABIH34_06185 [Nanoarchaeota archaeon]
MKKAFFVLGIFLLFVAACDTNTAGERTLNTATRDPAALKCTDSDGGHEYYVQGVVEARGEQKVDFCSGPVDIHGNQNQLTEYFCQRDRIMSELYTCPDGCAEGACLEPAFNDLAVTNLFFEPADPELGDPLGINGSICNFGDEPLSGEIIISCSIEGPLGGSGGGYPRYINLQPHDCIYAGCATTVNEPGIYTGTISIDPQDIPDDDPFNNNISISVEVEEVNETHLACINEQCLNMQGPGVDECSGHQDCWQCDIRATLNEGETDDYSFNGNSFHITSDYISSSGARFIVNLETTNVLSEGEQFTLYDDSVIGTIELLIPPNGTNMSDKVEFCIDVAVNETNGTFVHQGDTFYIGVDQCHAQMEYTGNNNAENYVLLKELSTGVVHMVSYEAYEPPYGGQAILTLYGIDYLFRYDESSHTLYLESVLSPCDLGDEFAVKDDVFTVGVGECAEDVEYTGWTNADDTFRLKVLSTDVTYEINYAPFQPPYGGGGTFTYNGEDHEFRYREDNHILYKEDIYPPCPGGNGSSNTSDTTPPDILQFTGNNSNVSNMIQGYLGARDAESGMKELQVYMRFNGQGSFHFVDHNIACNEQAYCYLHFTSAVNGTNTSFVQFQGKAYNGEWLETVEYLNVILS